MIRLLAQLSLLLFVSLLGCQEGQKTTTPPELGAIEDAKREVMAVHDPAMERLNDIETLTEQLKRKLEATEDSATQVVLYGRIDSLEIARRGMMDWMHQYNPTYPDELAEAQALAYLSEQRDSIARVAALIEIEIEKANAALK